MLVCPPALTINEKDGPIPGPIATTIVAEPVNVEDILGPFGERVTVGKAVGALPKLDPVIVMKPPVVGSVFVDTVDTNGAK